MFFRWREEARIPGQEINFDFDNVTFLLNALDNLAGDPRFLELRGHRPQHRTLEGFDAQTRDARKKAPRPARSKASSTMTTSERSNTSSGLSSWRPVRWPRCRSSTRRPLCSGSRTPCGVSNAAWTSRKVAARRNTPTIPARSTTPRRPRSWAYRAAYKFWAVIIPPIPPLLVAALVFFHRRGKAGRRRFQQTTALITKLSSGEIEMKSKELIKTGCFLAWAYWWPHGPCATGGSSVGFRPSKARRWSWGRRCFLSSPMRGASISWRSCNSTRPRASRCV